MIEKLMRKLGYVPERQLEDAQDINSICCKIIMRLALKNISLQRKRDSKGRFVK